MCDGMHGDAAVLHKAVTWAVLKWANYIIVGKGTSMPPGTLTYQEVLDC